ncbi:glutamate receptor 2-like [Babylonia areolata]|uniref:glutamate receptor 2-like n=1 Tax=Babylonia areolata TaxID=304850 RepID=UPI003FD00EDA
MSNGPPKPHFVVTTVLDAPFMSAEILSDGNTRYVGFLKDLIETLASDVGFDYEIRVAKDGSYGSQVGPQGWTGMIGELVNGTADIAAGALTMTRAREEVVRFITPIMTSDVSLLVKKPEVPKVPDEDSVGLGFLVTPFSTDFWIVLLVAMGLVGLLFFLIGLINPHERPKVTDGPGKGAGAAGGRICHVSRLRSSCLFALGSFTCQGQRSFSGRFLALFWWVFVLFIVMAYTARLYLKPPTPDPKPTMPFRTYEELVDAKDVQVGAVRSGSTQFSLRASRVGTLRNLWVKMQHDNSDVRSLSEGVDRVRHGEGKYVMFMESHTSEYMARRECDLMVYGDRLFSKNLAMATQKGHVVGPLLDKAIQDLRASGQLHIMRKRWWELDTSCADFDGRGKYEKGNASSLSSTKLPSSSKLPKPLTLRHMAVALFILSVGFLLALVVLVLEVLFHKASPSKADQASSDPEAYPVAGVSQPLSG